MVLNEIMSFIAFFQSMADYVQNFGHFGNFVQNLGYVKTNKNFKSQFHRYLETMQRYL